MLINNFSAGIIGMLLAILGYTVVGPVMSAILVVLAAGVNILVVHGLLPLVAIFIEPAKVLFLNNALIMVFYTAGNSTGGGDRQVDHVHAGAESGSGSWCITGVYVLL